MSNLEKLPWISYVQQMTEKYRGKVVETALGYLPETSIEMKDRLNRAIQIPGFRTIEKAPFRMAKTHIIRQMPDQKNLSMLVISIWAKAHPELLDHVKQQAIEIGVQFDPTWNHELAEEGYCTNDQIYPLEDIKKKYFRKYGDKALEDDVTLAAQFLSSAVLIHSKQKVLENKTSKEDHLPLFQIRRYLVEANENLTNIQNIFLTEIKTLPEIAKNETLNELRKRYGKAGKLLSNWESLWEDFSNRYPKIISQLEYELRSRPGFSKRTHVSFQDTFWEKGDTLDYINEISEIIKEIQSYDKLKEQNLQQLKKLQLELESAQEELAIWEQSVEKIITEIPILEITENTLEEIEKYQEITNESLEKVKDSLNEYRNMCQNSILLLAKKLASKNVKVPNKNLPEKFRESNLSDLTLEYLDQFDSEVLKETEKILYNLVSEQVKPTKSSPAIELANKLLSKWDEQSFEKIFRTLAKDQRDVEVLLLYLATSQKPDLQLAQFDFEISNSLFQGIELLGKDVGPFELVNWFANELSNHWNVPNKSKKAYTQASLYLLAAKYVGEYQLPGSYLIQLTSRWPQGRMPTWSKLWQIAYSDDTLPNIVIDDKNSHRKVVRDSYSDVERILKRDKGLFRLQNIQSKRHRAMLSKDVMPRFEKLFHILNDKDKHLESIQEKYKKEKAFSELENLVDAQYREEQIRELYDYKIMEFGIRDTPFHKRTTLDTMHEVAKNLREYAESLQAYWRKELSSDNIDKQALYAELSAIPKLKVLGNRVVKQLAQFTKQEQKKRDERKLLQQEQQAIVNFLMTQRAYSLRLPRVIGYLSQNKFSWKDIYEILLEDIGNPLGIEETVTHLLENQAPNQVLLLAEEISLKHQKKAQQLRDELKRQIRDLEKELVRLGENIEDKTNARDLTLGRWKFVLKDLNTLVQLLEIEKEEKKKKVQDDKAEYFAKINKWDKLLFEIEQEIPEFAYNEVLDGLSLCKKALTKHKFNLVQKYLDDLKYRINHEAWGLRDLRESTSHLKKSLEENVGLKTKEWKNKDIIELLENQEITELGFGISDIPQPTIETRKKLLYAWEDLRDQKQFLKKELTISSRDTTENLFRFFTQMTRLKRYKTEVGSSLDSNTPFIYSNYELIYPKTNEHNKRCVFIALPGSPPSSHHLAEVENLIEGKEWLDLYYVFLFSPGVTQAMKKRFETFANKQGQKRGLIIIDDPLLREMLLAETQSKKPVGILRSKMLNAIDAEDVDIFTVNQSVDEETAIFTGRKSWISNLAYGSENYVIYGGRRIGKSSLLKTVHKRIEKGENKVVFHDFQGQTISEKTTAYAIAKEFPFEVENMNDLKFSLEDYMKDNPKRKVVILLDEIDDYIDTNSERHQLLEVLRSVSNQYGSRFRVIVSGFNKLYDCIKNGFGSYTNYSDPWDRMFTDLGPLPNLKASEAGQIVKEGFDNILGWAMESRSIPKMIVEYTGGHPSFVQFFCKNIQERVGKRGDRYINLKDIEEVFNDKNQDRSFIEHVRSTIQLNLEALDEYIILTLAFYEEGASSFTKKQAIEIANLCDADVSVEKLGNSLNRLKVTSVVVENTKDVYEFSVPDYPMILRKLVDQKRLDELEEKIVDELGQK